MADAGTATRIELFLRFSALYQIPETASSSYKRRCTRLAPGCVAAGIYWPKANSVGAYGALVMGALAPPGS